MRMIWFRSKSKKLQQNKKIIIIMKIEINSYLKILQILDINVR